MATSMIICPSCKHQFEPGEVIREEVQKELRNKMLDWQKRKDEEFRQKENLLQQQLLQKDDEVSKRVQQEKQRLQAELQESIQKSVATDFENKMKILETTCADNEEKLKLARQREFEFLQKEQQLKSREVELELELERKLLKEREQLSVQIRNEENARTTIKETEFQMRLAEYEKKMKDQEKLIDEMKRKAEQGSMQLQGEVQELALEDILKVAFPFDRIVPVGKGVRGADCVQTICNPFGNDCGKIIYESKRTKDFSADWIDKLKADMRSQAADIAVIVTQTLPKEMERFGEKEGVYICTFSEVKSLASILRLGILRVYQVYKNQENKGDKVHLLYDYLTSNEFGEQWSAIREAFMSLHSSIQRERNTMERLWTQREKELQKVLLNANRIQGSIRGIAGADAVNMSLNDDSDALLLEDEE
jgi:hypothetical protein